MGSSLLAGILVVLCLEIRPSLALTERAQEYFDAREFDKALQELRGELGSLDLDALILMGRAYWARSGDKPDADRGFAYWLVAADRGNADAAFYAGRAYDGGIGTEQDFRQAQYWYEKAAEADHPAAIHNLASLYEHGRDTVEQDEERAFSLYLRAVELGNPASMSTAGDMLVEGRGTLRDFEQALELYMRAALLGEARAMRKLGDAYKEGKVASRDLVESYAWHSVAAQTYSQEAQHETSQKPSLGHRLNAELARRTRDRLSELEKEMERQQIVTAQERAKEILEKVQNPG
jgi:TPR repeat protein